MEKQLIHIVGGGENQVPLVLRAKERGYRVLVTDMFENPPARKHADLYERIDTTDARGTLDAARRHNIDFITTDMTDVAIPTVAFVAEELGLPGIGHETALRFTNKHLMRKSLPTELSRHLPESHFFENVNDANDFLRGVDLQRGWIVKPVNSQGSRGVFVVPAEPVAARERVFEAYTESRERGVLIERRIVGFEYSVETFVYQGKVHNLTLTKKYHYSNNPCLDERNTFLADVETELEQKLFAANEAIIHGLGLPFGLTHAEYIVEDGEVFLMEIAARGAGGSISSHIIPFLTGFDTLDAVLHVYTGQPVAIEIGDYKRRFAVLKFFQFAPGRVKRVIVNKPIADKALVFRLDLDAGRNIVPPKDSRDRAGYFVVCGTDREEVLDLERAVEASVYVEYEQLL